MKSKFPKRPQNQASECLIFAASQMVAMGGFMVQLNNILTTMKDDTV